MNDDALREIANLAIVLYTGYPETVKRSQQEFVALKAIRDGGLLEYEADALNAYQQTSRVLNQWVCDLDRLATLVRKHLPKLWEELEIVGRDRIWHWQEIDWRQAIRELRRIEATAIAAGSAGDGLEWSKPIGYKDLRKALAISQNTLKSRLVDGRDPVEGKIRYIAPMPTARKIQVVVSDLPADLQTRFRRSSK